MLVKQKASLNETLAVAPVALANIVHAYQPDLGAIATRGNLASLTKSTPACDRPASCSTRPLGGLPGSLNGLRGQHRAADHAVAASAKTAVRTDTSVAGDANLARRVVRWRRHRRYRRIPLLAGRPRRSAR